MDHCVGRTFYRFKGLADDMFSRLRQHLNGHIIGNHVAFDQGTDKIVLGIGRSRKTNLDLLETDLYQQLKEFQLIFQAHGIDQSLVTISQVNAAPDGGLGNAVLLHPVVGHLGGHKISFLIFCCYVCAVHGNPPAI